jgi:hypothetical protein
MPALAELGLDPVTGNEAVQVSRQEWLEEIQKSLAVQ